MATKPHTRMYTDGHSYSLFDPEEVHRDMRIDPVRAKVVLRRNAGVADAHEGCEECKRITAEHTANNAGVVPATYATIDESIVAHSERVTQLVVSRANLARMLRLGPGERVSRMFVSDDPQLLHVIVAGEHYQPVPDGAATPVSRASRRPGK